MKKNISLSLPAIKKRIFLFLKRFHVVLFVVIVLGGLSVVILLLSATITQSTEPGDYTPQSTNIIFDETTMQRIEELRTREQGDASIDTSQGRTNPFVE
jgi:hypothetical protein